MNDGQQKNALNKACWLIECRFNGPNGPLWLERLTESRASWTHDANEAVQFVRERDAKAIVSAYFISLASVTEHVWVGTADA